MSALLSWLIVLGIFLVVLVGVKQIGVAFDWVLDHMRWADSAPSGRTGTPHDSDGGCPCGQDRSYHDRMASG